MDAKSKRAELAPHRNTMRMSLWLRRLIARIEAGANGYLPQVGWVETRARRLALDADGAPTPWFTYPAISFLKARIKSEWRILEFGSGMGTIWWSDNAGEVLALEHEPEWLAQISASLPGMVVAAGNRSSTEYLQPAIGTGPWDIVVVDGLFREECLETAPELLSDRGVVILDDADRPQYQHGTQDLLTRGFRVLEFFGPQPVSKHPGCTTIFYRRDNILGI